MSRIHTARLVRTPTAGAQAMLVRDGVVLATGDLESLRSRDPDAEVVDHGDAIITPGMRDAHFHPVAYAAAITGVGLKTARNLDEAFARLRTAAAKLAPGAPLIAHRIDDETLAEGRLPTAAELDAVTGNRPALVMRYCGHVGIANGVALRMAGIGSDTPDPADGVIDRDPTGAPTGVLKEGAVDLVTSRIGRSGPVGAGDLQRAMLALAGLGITSIGAMVRTSYGPLGGLGDEVALLADVAASLPLRAHGYVIAADDTELDDAAARLAAAGGRLAWRGYKGFADGSFGGHTAAMCRPYADADTTGTLLLSDEDRHLARRSVAMGGDVALHAIGDRAAAAVLDLFEELIAEGVAPRRLRMEHVSVLQSDDIARMGRMQVGGAVQPAFLHSETGWITDRVGRERLATTYAFRSLLAAGVRLAGSSDCPVEPPDPWAAMAYARRREGVVPEQALDPAQAFALYTSGGAWLLGEPEPLAAGSPADFIVVDRDPVAVDADALAGTRVLRTFVGDAEIELDASIVVWPE